MKRMCFIKSEVEGEIYAMKEKISTSKILASTSLVFGILSLFSFVLYFYSANHAPYTYIDVIFWGPLCSFIGIVISIITRKRRKIHPALWTSGIISCMLGFIVCVFPLCRAVKNLFMSEYSKLQTGCMTGGKTDETLFWKHGNNSYYTYEFSLVGFV